MKAEDPRPEDLYTYDYAPTPVTEEKESANRRERNARSWWIVPSLRYRNS